RRTPEQEHSLMGALLAFCAESSIQDLVAEVFADSQSTVPTRLLLLSVLSRCRLDPLPPSWLDVLQQALEQPDLSLQREVVAVVKVRNLDRFDRRLAALSQNDSLPADLRIAALECLAPRRKQTD